MFLLAVFVSGIVLGAIAVVGVEALGFLFLIKKLTRKTRRVEESFVASKDVDDLQSLDFALPKQGDIWVLEPERVPKNWSEIITKELERKKKFFEVFPVRKHAMIKDHCLILKESEGSSSTIQLKGCMIKAVSATNLPSRKWAKRFPIKLQSKTSAIYKGSKTLCIYLDTSWDKESWCKALQLASTDDHIQLSRFSNLHEEFDTYLNTLREGYPLFTKPQSGFHTKPMDKEKNRVDGPSKVRLVWKKLARKMSKSNQDSVLITSSGRATLPPRYSSLPRSGSRSRKPVPSDAELDGRVSVDEGTLCWNLLISRLFFDVKNSERIRKSIQERIQRTLLNMRTPSYIGEVICTNINLGNLPPHIYSIRVLPLDTSKIWAFEVDLEYSGCVLLDIETRIEMQELDLPKELVDPDSEPTPAKDDVSSVLLEEFEELRNQLSLSVEKSDEQDGKGEEDPKSEGLKSSKTEAPPSAANHKSRWKSIKSSVAKHVSQVPISLRIRVASLQGTVRFRIKPPPSDQLWFCFTSMPDIEFNLESSVGEHKFNSSHFALLLINRFKASIRETMVSPNSESVWLPFMLAEKDDWVPRKAAPFIWLNQQPTPALGKSSSYSQPSDSRPNTTGPETRRQKPKSANKSEQTQRTDDACSSSSETPRQNRSAQDLTTPLLTANDDGHEEHVEFREISVGDSSLRSGSERSVGSWSSNSNGGDEGKGRKMGRRARMLDLGKKMGEKIEEKRRHIEDKGRNIVEKMRR